MVAMTLGQKIRRVRWLHFLYITFNLTLFYVVASNLSRLEGIYFFAPMIPAFIGMKIYIVTLSLLGYPLLGPFADENSHSFRCPKCGHTLLRRFMRTIDPFYWTCPNCGSLTKSIT